MKSLLSKWPKQVCKIVYKILNSSNKLIDVDQKKLNTIFNPTVWELLNAPVPSHKLLQILSTSYQTTKFHLTRNQ